MNTHWRAPVSSDLDRLAPEEVFLAGEHCHHVANTAYPIAHARTWGPYRVPRLDHREVVERSFRGIRELGIYVHIPFCESRCYFCEYTVLSGEDATRSREYLELLLGELELYRKLLGDEPRLVRGFDLGGGTPSFLEGDQIAAIVDRVREAFPLAPGTGISIETTPRIAASRPDKLVAFREAGIERISFGVQVTQPDLLRRLNRSENGLTEHVRAMAEIRAAGFERVNVDLMYGFAGQTEESWRATLDHALALGPEYVTLYRMRYKATRIEHQAARVSREQAHRQRALASEVLAAAGYQGWAGKNTFSRLPGDPGTSDYLTRRVIRGMPYLGLGLGAQTFTDTTLSFNQGAASKRLAPYRRRVLLGQLPLQDLYELPRIHAAAKMVAVSFYFGEVNLPAFRDKFGAALEVIYPEAHEFVLREGLMELRGEGLALTERGVRCFHGTLALFYAPSVQRVLLERAEGSAGAEARRERLAV